MAEIERNTLKMSVTTIKWHSLDYVTIPRCRNVANLMPKCSNIQQHEVTKKK